MTTTTTTTANENENDTTFIASSSVRSLVSVLFFFRILHSLGISSRNLIALHDDAHNTHTHTNGGRAEMYALTRTQNIHDRENVM